MRTTITAACCAASILLAACGQSSDSEPAPDATATEPEPTAATGTESAAAVNEPERAPAVPLLDLGDSLTWNELLRTVASDREQECVADTIDDEDLPEDFLDHAVFSEPSLFGTWPTWHQEVVGIDVGDNHWPHQVWLCLDAETASAVYISVRLEETKRDGISVSDGDTACIMRLPTDTELQEAVSDRLGSEYSFPDGEDLSDFLSELDLIVDAKLLPCLSDAVAFVLDTSLAVVLADAVSEDERACLVDAIMGDDSLAVAPLFREDTPEDYFETQLLPAIESALETCELANVTS